MPRSERVHFPADPASALEAYDPARGHGPWDAAHAAHLLRRALGGGRPGQVQELLQGSVHEAVEQLLQPTATERAKTWMRTGAALAAQSDRAALASWWLMKMLQDDCALGSRLALFWHDHFATTWSKVERAEQMLAQHHLFTELGAGRFHPLLSAVLKDPAMLRFLDGDSNRRGLPNENLARELLELFTLGVGHYSEGDIRQGARALTGRTVRRGVYHFEALHFEAGDKSVFGQTIADGDDLAQRAVEHGACAPFLARKLWRFYVSPDPPLEVIELLAHRWREHDLEVAWLLRTLLSSRAFHASDSIASLVKSPVDFVVGTMRALGARPDPRPLQSACARMGQWLFEPPGVQGWNEGEAWIHPAAWLERTRFAGQVAGGEGGLLRDAPLARLFPRARRQDSKPVVDDLLAAFLPGVLDAARQQQLTVLLDNTRGSKLQQAIYAILCLPEYHLS